jgi:hypothetical protein
VKTVRVELENPTVEMRTDWGGITVAVLEAYRKNRNGIWEQYIITLPNLEFEELACIGRAARQAVETGAANVEKRAREAKARIRGELSY